MNHLTADTQMLAMLSQAGELTEIRTADGQSVGFFVPGSVRKARMWAEAADHLDTVNLVNGKTDHEVTYTTRQVLEHILRQAPDERGKDDLRQTIQRMKAEEATETLDPKPPPDADPPLDAGGPP